MPPRRTFGLLLATLLCPPLRAAASAIQLPAADAGDVVRQHPQFAGQTLRLRVPDPGSLSIHPLAAACLRLPEHDDIHLLFGDALVTRWTQGGFDKLRGKSVLLTVRVRDARFGKNVLADVLDFSAAS